MRCSIPNPLIPRHRSVTLQGGSNEKANEVLGFFIHHPDPTDAPLYKALAKVKDGKFAQGLLKRIHSKGLTLEEFAKLEKTPRFKRAFAALMKAAPSPVLMKMLRTAAIEMGVPLETIKAYPQMNLAVAIEVLKEFFPECNEKWIEELSQSFAAIYKRNVFL